jgi:hypothetical protein
MARLFLLFEVVVVNLRINPNCMVLSTSAKTMPVSVTANRTLS